MIKRILVAVDFSMVTRRVLAAAAQQALISKAKVLLIHVEQPDPEFVGYKTGPNSVRKSVSKEIRSSHKKLRVLEQQLQKKEIPVTALLLQGPTAQKIIKEARTFKANIIVMGTHSKSPLKEILLGSVSKAVLQKTNCPVLLVKCNN